MSISTETQADLDAVCRALSEGRPVDPEVSRRIEARAADLRKRMPKIDGELSVQLIRDIRDEA